MLGSFFNGLHSVFINMARSRGVIKSIKHKNICWMDENCYYYKSMTTIRANKI